MSASPVWELEELIRELDPEAQTIPDKRGGAAFLYASGGNIYRLTLSAPSIVRHTLEQTGNPVPLPAGLMLPAWAIRSREQVSTAEAGA